MSDYQLHDKRISNFLDGCHEAGIRDPVKFMLDKIPRVYGFLKGAFPRGILPSDIDGEVELHGFFLRFEFKYADALLNGRIPKGQIMHWQALMKTGFFTLFCIGHDSTGDITHIQIWMKGKVLDITPCALNDLRDKCSRWSRWAEAHTPVYCP